MKVPAAIAEILKREGVDVLFGYPRNAVLEAAAEADIRTVIVRQERTGLHMADAYSRMTASWSRISCSAPRSLPRKCVLICPATHSTGVVAPSAVSMAAEALRKPGPGTTEQTPGRPVALA